MAKSSKVPRIMYIESKATGLNGPARIGRVSFSKTRLSIYYKGKTFTRIQGFKANYQDAETHDEYWISGPHRDGKDRLYVSNIPVEIDDDVREEFGQVQRANPLPARNFIGRRFEKSLTSRAGLRPERVSNPQPTVNYLTILQILRIEQLAFRL